MGVIWFIAAAGWGIAEATLFFIVPDVILTYAVLRHGWRAGARLAVVTAAAAALAGIGMWMWGRNDPAGAQHVMLLVPAIGPDLIGRVAREMGGLWTPNLLAGAITGVPYKLYAVEAGTRAIPLVWFVPASFAARLVRFLFSVGVTWLGVRILARYGHAHRAPGVLTIGWVAIYGFYFAWRAAAG